MVTHDPVAASYADNVVFLVDGQIVSESPAHTAESSRGRVGATIPRSEDMIRLALSSLRFRTAAFLAIFVAVLLGSALMSAAGGLLETGLRLNASPQRLADAPIIVTGRPAYHPPNGSGSVAYPERHGVDPALVAKLAGTTGVAKAIPDVSFPAVVAPGRRSPDRSRLGSADAHAVQAHRRYCARRRAGRPRPPADRRREARRRGERDRQRRPARVRPGRRRRHRSTRSTYRPSSSRPQADSFAAAGRRDRSLSGPRYDGRRPRRSDSSCPRVSRR